MTAVLKYIIPYKMIRLLNWLASLTYHKCEKCLKRKPDVIDCANGLRCRDCLFDDVRADRRYCTC